MIKYLILFSAIIATVSCRDTVNVMTLDTIYTRFMNGEEEVARDLLIDFLESSESRKKYIDGWVLLGNFHLDLEEDSLADIAFRRVLKLDSEEKEGFIGLATALRYQAESAKKQGDYKKTETYLMEAISLQPEQSETYLDLSSLFLKQKKLQKAIEAGEKARALDKTNPEIPANLTIVYHYAGDSTNTKKNYEIAKELNYEKLKFLDIIRTGRVPYTFSTK